MFAEFKASLAEKAALSIERDNAKAESATLSKQVVELTSKVAKAEETISDLSAKLTSAETALKDAKLEAGKVAESHATELKAATDAKLAAESKAKELVDNPSAVALEIAAKAGVKPDQRPPASNADQKTITSSEFEAMSHKDRNAFIRSGGRIA